MGQSAQPLHSFYACYGPDPGFLILTDQRRPFLPCWIFMDVTADYSFSDFRSPFSVPRSTFHVPRSPLPAPGSRLICSPVWAPAPVHFFFFWLSHSGFSRNTSNGNPGSIKSFPTNKVHFEEKKKIKERYWNLEPVSGHC